MDDSASASASGPGYDVLLFLSVVQISSVLSILAAFSIILYYILNKHQRSFTLRMIVFLSMTNIGTAIGFLLENRSSESLCLAGASFVSFFSVSSFLWSCCIAVNLYTTIFGKRGRSSEFEIYYHAVSWLVPLICFVFPLSFDMYSHTFITDGIGCWFKDEYSWGRILFFDGWIMLAWTFNVVIFSLVIRQNRAMVMQSLYVDQDPITVQHALNNQEVVRTLLLNFVICWTWSIVLAFFAIADVDTTQPSTIWVLLFFCMFAPLQAFLNFMTFLIRSSEFRRNFWIMILRICCCYSPNSDFAENEPLRRSSINYGTNKADDIMSM